MGEVADGSPLMYGVARHNTESCIPSNAVEGREGNLQRGESMKFKLEFAKFGSQGRNMNLQRLVVR